MFVNDASINEFPLSKRYELLQGVVRNPKETFMEVMQHQSGKTADDVIRFLDQMMLQQQEGLVIKDPESAYVPNERGNSWLKLKADYISHIAETLVFISTIK